MISFLRGIVMEKLIDSLTLDVGGVGYEVKTTPRILQAARLGVELALHTHLQVKDDAFVLFGFLDIEERHMFRTLLSVNGVGPKTALSVMSVAGPTDIIRAVQRDDVAVLKAPGVGPKIVKRLISELKTVFGEMPRISLSVKSGQDIVRTDVIEALVSLGYNERETQVMLSEVELDGKSLEEAVRAVLQKR